MFANPIFLRLRSAGRKTGVNRILGRLLGLLGYENSFSAKILSTLREGDCVWDVGANVGLYSTKFAGRVGKRGKVVAFEPSRECFNSLSQAMAEHASFVGVNGALGRAEGVANLHCAADPLAATHTLSLEVGKLQSHQGTTYEVAVHTADGFASNRPELTPNVVKIDVEGFELAVIEGMSKLLNTQGLRALFIEVHFSLLEAQGLKDAPTIIVEKLRTAGFSVTWPDLSHIAAIRK